MSNVCCDSSFLGKLSHIEHAEAATTAAYAASDWIGDATDRCLGAGAWAKLLAP